MSLKNDFLNRVKIIIKCMAHMKYPDCPNVVLCSNTDICAELIKLKNNGGVAQCAKT